MNYWLPFTTTLMQRHCFRTPPFCLWRGNIVHTKPHKNRTGRRIWVAQVQGWILTTRHSLSFQSNQTLSEKNTDNIECTTHVNIANSMADLEVQEK